MAGFSGFVGLEWFFGQDAVNNYNSSGKWLTDIFYCYFPQRTMT